MSAAAQVRPDPYVRSCTTWSGRAANGAAGALFKVMPPVIRLLFAEPNPGPVKAALAMQGKVRDELRLPMTPMSSAGQHKLAEALEPLMELPACGPPATGMRRRVKAVCCSWSPLLQHHAAPCAAR